MKLKHMAIAALAASMLSAPGVVAAQPVGHMGGGGHHFELTEILHGLNLTDAQKQQAHLAEQAAWARAKPVLEQMHALHEQIATQFLTAGTTAAQLAPLVRQEEQLRSKLDSEHLTVALQIRNLLTADQLAKAATLHAQLSALHQQERDVLQGAHDGAN